MKGRESRDNTWLGVNNEPAIPSGHRCHVALFPRGIIRSHARIWNNQWRFNRNSNAHCVPRGLDASWNKETPMSAASNEGV